MKKIYVLALVIAISSASSKAQLKVVNDGRVEIACSDDNTAESRFAVGGGQSGFAASFKGNSLNSSGVYAEAGVPTNNPWMIGIKGSSYMYDNNLYDVTISDANVTLRARKVILDSGTFISEGSNLRIINP